MGSGLSTLRTMFGSLIGLSPDGKRNMAEIFKYPEAISYSDYRNLYARGDIAKRIVDMIPQACWSDAVGMKDGEEEVFETELKVLKRLGMFKAIKAADVLNRIGNFSVLYVGIPDNQEDLTQPAGTSNKNSVKNLFFTAYSYDGVTITKWDTDVTSPRCGQPILYQLQTKKPSNREIKDSTTKSIIVHYTRVVLMNEGALESKLDGVPYLEATFNRFIDLDKTAGGSAEAYFRNARGKTSFETSPEFAASLTDEAKAQLDEDAEAFQNDWKDFIKLAGMKANPLTTPHHDPKETGNLSLKLISGATGIPLRVLTGEGGGQTTGAEDKATYNQLIQDRQSDECEFWLWNLLTILRNAKLFPEWKPSAEFDWPINEVLNELDKSMVRKNNSEAVKNVSDAINDLGGLASELSPQQAIEEVLDLEYKPILSDGLDDDDLDDDLNTGHLDDGNTGHEDDGQ